MAPDSRLDRWFARRRRDRPADGRRHLVRWATHTRTLLGRDRVIGADPPWPALKTAG